MAEHAYSFRVSRVKQREKQIMPSVCSLARQYEARKALAGDLQASLGEDCDVFLLEGLLCQLLHRIGDSVRLDEHESTVLHGVWKFGWSVGARENKSVRVVG